MADEMYMEFDFRGAPPIGGGLTSDRFPPGTYRMMLVSLSNAPAKSGRPMVTAGLRVSGGDYAGKRLVERFTIARKGEKGDSKIGLQLWHRLLVGLGMKVQEGKLNIDINRFLDKECIVEVDDVTEAASGQYPERVVSRPRNYHRLNSDLAQYVKDGTGAEVAAPAKAKKAKKEEPETTAESESPDSPESPEEEAGEEVSSEVSLFEDLE